MKTKQRHKVIADDRQPEAGERSVKYHGGKRQDSVVLATYSSYQSSYEKQKLLSCETYGYAELLLMRTIINSLSTSDAPDTELIMYAYGNNNYQKKHIKRRAAPLIKKDCSILTES